MKQVAKFWDALIHIEVRKVEARAINVVSAVSPWLAPVIPAYLTYTHMLAMLYYPQWVALIGAIVVECIGLASIYTANQFHDYNDAKTIARDNRLIDLDKKQRSTAQKKRQQRAPVRMAIGLMGFYVFIILTVNALLEMESTQSGFTVKVLTNGLLSLLSVVAGLLIAVRAQHARRLNEKEDRAATRTRRDTGTTSDTTLTRQSDTDATLDATPATREQFVTAWSNNGHQSVAALADKMHVHPRTAQRWVEKELLSHGSTHTGN